MAEECCSLYHVCYIGFGFLTNTAVGSKLESGHCKPEGGYAVVGRSDEQLIATLSRKGRGKDGGPGLVRGKAWATPGDYFFVTVPS